MIISFIFWIVQRGKAKIEPLQLASRPTSRVKFCSLKKVKKKKKRKGKKETFHRHVQMLKCLVPTSFFLFFLFLFLKEKVGDREILKIKSKKSNIDQYVRIFPISKRLCLCLFPSQCKGAANCRCGIFHNAWGFTFFFLLFLFYASDSLGPQASPHNLTCMLLLLNSLNTDVRDGFSAFIPSL